MSQLKFNIYGHLLPEGETKVDFGAVYKYFVEPFESGHQEEKSVRESLYQSLLTYNERLAKITGQDIFKQWLDGSFVSTKVAPDDVDLVTFIDAEVYYYNEKKLNELNSAATKDELRVDAYFVKLYPSDHKFFVRTHSDTIYWLHLFSSSKGLKRKPARSKGFISYVSNI